MTVKLFILYFSTITLTCIGQEINCNNIDSIYIKNTSLNVFTTPAVSKEDFEDFYNNKSEKTKVSKVIKSKKEICNICNILNNLTFDSALEVGSNISKKQAFVSKKGMVFWLPIDDLDIRSQIILFSKGKFDLVWVSNPSTDIGSNRFITSKELRDYLQELLNKK